MGEVLLTEGFDCSFVDQDPVLQNSSKGDADPALPLGPPGASVCKEELRIYGSSVCTGGCFRHVTDPRIKKNNETEKPQEISQLD